MQLKHFNYEFFFSLEFNFFDAIKHFNYEFSKKFAKKLFINFFTICSLIFYISLTAIKNELELCPKINSLFFCCLSDFVVNLVILNCKKAKNNRIIILFFVFSIM